LHQDKQRRSQTKKRIEESGEQSLQAWQAEKRKISFTAPFPSQEQKRPSSKTEKGHHNLGSYDTLFGSTTIHHDLNLGGLAALRPCIATGLL
jgi:hypothetical protein